MRTILVLALAATAHAQTSRGVVAGAVLDPSGAVVAAAHVVLTGVETGVRRTTTSNESGIYRFESVDLGLYELTVAHAGFRTFRGTGIGVEANRVTSVDPHLEVGVTETEIEVSAAASEVLVRDSPLRGGNFVTREARDLPLISYNPLSLARTLPGVTQATGSGLKSSDGGSLARGSEFSVNGQRTRGNNNLLDGAEDNDIGFTGVAQPFNIAEAVEEVSVQTGNFGVEFGRAGGGIFNIVTRSGTNRLHGSLLWRYQSQRFNSVSNVYKLNGTPKSVFSNNVYGFTVGGPVRKNKTFFFAAFQQDNTHATNNFSLTVPTADAVATLRSLFPSNPRLDLYLSSLGDLRGSGLPFPLALGADPQTGLDRGSVQFAASNYVLPSTNDGPQWLGRVDHYWSEKHRLSWRYVFDSRVKSPSSVAFPGFILDKAYRNQNFLFADSYTFGPSYTNEFRFSYGRLHANEGAFSALSVPLAQTLPNINIGIPPLISAPGIGSQMLQFRFANNLLFQETQTKLIGRHAFRYGVELLRQLATQAPSANILGNVGYTAAPALGYSAFANFLDDYSGPSAMVTKVFGAEVFHPDVLRQSYFFQDNWRVTPALALTLGLRYENFGQPANVIRYPGFTGFDPARFLERIEVNPDDNNFGPAFGFAWSPTSKQWLGNFFGNGKTVWRGGYQISYDAFFTQMISLGPATATPNASSTQTTSETTGRGTQYWSTLLPTVAHAPSLADAQTGALDKDLRSPYTQRWSFGFQRQMPQQILLDVSYVGSVSHKLTTRSDLNPLQVNSKRLYPNFGQRLVETSQGNSAYHALQTRVDRRFARGFQVSGSYTWSRMIDSTSEGVGSGNAQSSVQNLTSVPVSSGGLKLDRGVSDLDRSQRLTLVYIWQIPGPRTGLWKYALTGWSVAGVTTFQSGTPFTVTNGTDRNSDGIPTADRPDIGNPQAPMNSRANIAPGCSSGYRDPDAGVCVNPGDVHWIEGSGVPNAATVGRNTLRTGGTNNFDANLSKAFRLGEKRRLEFRWEALNAFNHPQFVLAPQRSVSVGGTTAGHFLNRDFTDSGIRSMFVQIKLVF